MIFARSPVHVSEAYIYKPGKDVMHLFWSSVSRKVSQTFIILFSSVYVFEKVIDFGFSNRTAALFVVFYFLTTIFFKLLFLLVAENLSRRTGFKGMIWLSAVPFAVYVPSLIFASGHPAYFFPAALLYGVHSAFYWWGYHGYFIKAGDQDHFGQGLGEIEFLNTAASVLTPFIGGLLIILFGFSISYVIAGLFMFLSLILLGKGKDKKQSNDVTFSEVLRLFFKHKSMSLAYVGQGIEGLSYVFAWPLFLLFVLGGVAQLGIFVTVSGLLAAVAGVFIGKKIDEQGERGIVALASPILAFSWLLKAVSVIVPILVIAESLRNFGERMFGISLTELSYKKAVEAYTARALLFRELGLITGGTIALLFFAVLILWGYSFESFFAIVALASLLPLVAIYRNRI